MSVFMENLFDPAYHSTSHERIANCALKQQMMFGEPLMKKNRGMALDGQVRPVHFVSPNLVVPARYNLLYCVQKQPDLEAKFIAKQQDWKTIFHALERATFQLSKLQESDLFLVLAVNSELLIASLQASI